MTFEQQWSGPELLAELRRFEAALRAAGLGDQAIGTYIGRSETFVRWLTGDYAPPVSGLPADGAAQGTGRSLGLAVINDLRAVMSRDDITRYLADYSAVTGYDVSYQRLLDATGGHLDLQARPDRVAVIGWLRAWGCRHLRRTDTDRTAEVLRVWWDAWAGRLPGPAAVLTGLGEADFLIAGQAYDELQAAPAAGRNLKGRDIDVAFGDTAAAKVMFAVRPQVFLPWDEPIRLAFGWQGGGTAYAQLLTLSASALNGLASRLAVPVAALPQILERPGSSPPKLVDEFLWVRITKGL